jgi:pimeloyl-ACP methyl ester carboxylesterase
MLRARRPATIGVLLGCLVAMSSCGGGGRGDDPPSPVVTPTQSAGLAYRPGVRLDARRTSTRTEGALRVEQFQYRSVDGQRVPALFAVPTAEPPLGCLIFVPGFSLPKETNPTFRQGLALLRLATFSIDARHVGARGSVAEAKATVRTAEGVRAMLLDTVTDLRVGLDWLSRRRECHDNIAVLGTSYGATVATHLAAQDHRIRAAVLTSVGATYKQSILMRPLVAQRVANLPDYVAGGAEDPAVLAHAVKVLGPYDLDRWIGKIAPRPVMIINGRFDPVVAPADALQLAAAAGSPKTVLYFNGGHDPFSPGPDFRKVSLKASGFLLDALDLPVPFG